MRNVEKLNPGDSVDHFFLIHRATQGVTAQGKDYMTLFLQDKSGDIAVTNSHLTLPTN